MYTCDIQRNVITPKVYYESLVISKEDMTLLEKRDVELWDFDNYIYIYVSEEKNA